MTENASSSRISYFILCLFFPQAGLQYRFLKPLNGLYIVSRQDKRINAGNVLPAVRAAAAGLLFSGQDGGVGRAIRKNGGYFLLSREAGILPSLAACLTNAADASRCVRSSGRVGRILVSRNS